MTLPLSASTLERVCQGKDGPAFRFEYGDAGRLGEIVCEGCGHAGSFDATLPFVAQTGAFISQHSCATGAGGAEHVPYWD